MNNIINHIALVLDASLSMTPFSDQLIRVADKQIQYLARRSKELDQETRITVYTFSSKDTWSSQEPDIRCLIYDKDVLRMPSIAGLYKPNGATPLIDATLLALNDLEQTPEKYGEHSFLVYVLTDGEENISRNSASTLQMKIDRLPDHWTLATFVPNQIGVREAKSHGFPKDNIAVWDATSAAGINEVGERIRQATETFMVNRSKGIRSTRNLFSLNVPSVSQVTHTMGDGLHPGQYRIYDVDETGRIDEFVERMTGRAYKLGEAYYQLMKPETIQPQKNVAILANYKVYEGREARHLLGLPDEHVRVAPSSFPGYDIFVQSTSVNRKLIAGTKLLILS